MVASLGIAPLVIGASKSDHDNEKIMVLLNKVLQAVEKLGESLKPKSVEIARRSKTPCRHGPSCAFLAEKRCWFSHADVSAALETQCMPCNPGKEDIREIGTKLEALQQRGLEWDDKASQLQMQINDLKEIMGRKQKEDVSPDVQSFDNLCMAVDEKICEVDQKVEDMQYDFQDKLGESLALHTQVSEHMRQRLEEKLNDHVLVVQGKTEEMNKARGEMQDTIACLRKDCGEMIQMRVHESIQRGMTAFAAKVDETIAKAMDVASCMGSGSAALERPAD